MKTSRRGYSLHIGLNGLDPGHYDGWRGSLRACEADADDMKAIAVGAGFHAGPLCKTRDATRERITSEIEKAAAELRSRDLFFSSYSGHGGQVRDVDGVYDRNRAFYDGLQDRIPGRRGPLGASVRLLSGCRDDQLSGDGAFNGVFTAALLRAWNRGAFQGDYGAFHRTIRGLMPDDQTPQHSVIGAPDPEFDRERPFTI